MTTINTNNVLRLTVRIDVENDHRCIDLAIPSSSHLSEIIDEITALAEAPLISTPWEAVTAAGQPLPLFEPLSECFLTHGDILVLRPQTEATAPVLLDAAESLAAETTTTPLATGTALATAASGYIGLLLLALSFPTPAQIHIPTAARLFLVAAACIAMVCWTRKPLFLTLATISCGLVGVLTILGDKTTPRAAYDLPAQVFAFNWGLALIAGGGLAIITTLVLRILIPAATMTTALITGTSLIMGAGLGALAYHPSALTSMTPAWAWLVNAAGIIAALGIILLAVSPTLAIKLSGLKIPIVPSAGQDLSVSDEPADINHHHGACLAVKIHNGLIIGLAATLSPALITIGLLAPQKGFGLALGITTAATLILHAHRHRQAANTWALWLTALAAALSCFLATFYAAKPHWLMILTCIIIATLLITAPGWADKITTFEPTTVVWLERLEALCIAACLPLALHIVGLFGLLRGIAL
jgi:hypothetical protein